MREQLTITAQPAHLRMARSFYRSGLIAWFRWGKIALSWLANLWRAKAEWPGHQAAWSSLDEYAAWLPHHLRWKPDPLGGAFDTFLDRATIAGQFARKGILEKDCDGLALFSAQNVGQFIADPDQVYIVTILLDPFSFDKDRLNYAAHVICVFAHDGDWRVISNDTLYPDVYLSFTEAVQHNPYCASHPVMWAEVRSPSLKPIFSGTRLKGFEEGIKRPGKR